MGLKLTPSRGIIASVTTVSSVGPASGPLGQSSGISLPSFPISLKYVSLLARIFQKVAKLAANHETLNPQQGDPLSQWF